MTDPVKIVPRYGDPDASNNYAELPANNVATPPKSIPVANSVLYDYVYTNKWIILAIIIIIILVAIGVYYFMQPEEKSIKTNPVNNAHTAPNAVANAAPAPPSTPIATTMPSKQELEDILAAAQDPVAAPKNTNSSKTVEEIEQMLNDNDNSEVPNPEPAALNENK